MKKIVLGILAIAIAGFTLQSCKTDANAGPKAAAESFLNHMKNGEYEKAKEFGTEGTDKMMDMLTAFSSMMPDSMKEAAKKATITLGDIKVEGEKATVAFSSSDAPGQTENIDMIMKDGKWLVDMKMPEAPAAPEGTEMPEAPAAPAK